MSPLGSNFIDFAPIWTFTLILARFAGVFLGIPGVGTDQVPQSFRFFPALACTAAVLFSGVESVVPAHIGEALLMMFSEITLGYCIGFVPGMVLGGLAVAGQVISGAIGLGQANMMDRSLGGQVAVLARIKILLATSVFLLIDGHHAVLRAASGTAGELGLGLFRPGPDVAMVMVQRLSTAFELAAVVAAPVLVTTLVTQFVLGLITKFVPQVNIFIISLPLGLMVGLYIMEFSLPGIINHTVKEFLQLEEIIGQIFPPSAGR